MKLLEQDKDFNCAVYALHFILGLNYKGNTMNTEEIIYDSDVIIPFINN